MTQKVEQLVQETMASYYEYIAKLEKGCDIIVATLRQGGTQTGLQSIGALSDGLSWLLEVEQLLAIHSYKIDSPIASVSPLFGKINSAIETNEFTTVLSLLEDDVKPLFKNTSDWKFKKVVS